MFFLCGSDDTKKRRKKHNIGRTETGFKNIIVILSTAKNLRHKNKNKENNLRQR